jgi:hypothetical protein
MRTFNTFSLVVFLQDISGILFCIVSDSLFSSPQATELSWEEWWMKAEAVVDSDIRKGLNTLITLGAWTIWRHRNDCVFNGATPRLDTTLLLIKEEVELWCLVGVKGISLLTVRGSLGTICFGPVVSLKFKVISFSNF